MHSPKKVQRTLFVAPTPPSAQFEIRSHLGLEWFGKKTKYFKEGKQPRTK